MKSEMYYQIANQVCEYKQVRYDPETFHPYETVTLRMPVQDEQENLKYGPMDVIIQDAKSTDLNFEYDNLRDLYHALLDEVLDNKEKYTK